MSTPSTPVPLCAVCSHPVGSHERRADPLGAPCTLTETHTGRACWCTGYRPDGPLAVYTPARGEQYMSLDETPPAVLEALERLGPFISRSDRAALRTHEFPTIPATREDHPVTHSPLLASPALPHLVTDRDVALKVATGHAYGNRPPGGRSSTVMHLELSQDGGAAMNLEMTADEAVAVAAAVLEAAGVTRHRVIDLGDELPEVTVQLDGGERTWWADGSAHAHDDAHDVELTMAPVRRRLAVLQHVATSESRHPEQAIDGVAAFLRHSGLALDGEQSLSPIEARYQAAELLDELRRLGVLAETPAGAGRHLEADRG